MTQPASVLASTSFLSAGPASIFATALRSNFLTTGLPTSEGVFTFLLELLR
ncbi:MAG: hypothetical protein BWX70_03160 [Verrucomicrobia bacterium ADurb.Bin070]|nr:MAG: hypothetical protein BWX70_03160 [Verrucomicrobia bacterium ADurb.Bin070]